MRRTCLLLAAALTLGCGSKPVGTACDPGVGSCGEGYACIHISRPTAAGREEVDVCHVACERSSDCPGGGCFLYSDYGERTCLGVGTAAVGEHCLSPEDCAPGLRCAIQFRYRTADNAGTCMPGCELFSPHSADRTCAAGTACLSYGGSPGNSESFCAPGCDVAAQTGCEEGEVCVWMEVPGQPNAPMCWPATALSRCSTVIRDCEANQVCGQDGECYAPQDAPPRVVLAVEPPID